jgi:hypothetical protein
MIPLTIFTTEAARIVLLAAMLTYAIVSALYGYMCGGKRDTEELTRYCRRVSRKHYVIAFALAAISFVGIRFLIVPKALAGTIVVLLGAILLHKLKLKALKWYAYLELAFAIVITLKTMAGMGYKVGLGDMSALFVSAYLIIRGLDNLHKSMIPAGVPQKPASTPSYTFSIVDGSLRPGQTLNPLTGEIEGEPDGSDNDTFVVGVKPVVIKQKDAEYNSRAVECSNTDSPGQPKIV